MHLSRSQDEKAVEIFNVLKAKRFLVLLDDVWERLDLDKVGVRSPTYSQNKSKVILTTRSLDACHLMEAQKSIKVECLTREEAINLFKEKVGKTTLNSHLDIPHLAEIAAKECKGLPLSLVTIGRAMAGKNTPQQWERAIQTLKTYPSKLSATTYSDNHNKILVEENDIVEVHPVAKWIEQQRMYLSFSSMTESIIPPSFPNLLTLILKGGSSLKKFPSGFFNFMPIIKFLDLSHTRTAKLPIRIGQLVTLEYLNLSHTSLTELSTELKALKKMRCLLLQNVPHLQMIPKETISNLSRMRVFFLSYTANVEEEQANYSREDNQALYFVREDNKALLEELEGMEHINYVTFQIECVLSFEKLLSSQKLKNAMWNLRLGNLEELEVIKVDDQETIEGRWRFVEDCHNNILANSYFCCLRDLMIQGLPKLLELTWLIYIPSLETLYVHDSESMEDMIGDGVSGNLGIFSRLRYLGLVNLPNLRSINRRALAFPCLTELYVCYCPKLRKLPLDSNSTARNSTKIIKGESNWWEGLEWENETSRLTFTRYFRAI